MNKDLFKGRYKIFLTLITALILFSTNIAFAASDSDLSDALSYGQYDQVKKLISTGKFNLNKKLKSGSCEGLSPLGCASSTEMIQLLIDNGADINKKIGGYTALEAASGNKDRGYSAMFLLEKGAKPTGFALFQALWYENTELAKKLIDMGVDVNYVEREGSGYSPLIIACQNGYSLELIKKLVNAGANVKFTSDEKFTALHFFPTERSTGHQGFVGDMNDLKISNETTIEKVKYLISKGASLKARSKYGTTPFTVAAYKNEDVALMLIELGVKVSKKSKECREALINASGAGFHRLMIKLLDGGVSVNSKDKNRRTPIFYAAQSGNYKTIKMLIDRGANCRVYDRKRATPLHMISIWPTARSHYDYLENHEADFYKGLELILKKSGKGMIHKRNRYGETPWFNLTGWMYPLPEKIKIFLKYGAKKNTRDRKTRRTLRQTLLKSYNSGKSNMSELPKKFYIESIKLLK